MRTSLVLACFLTLSIDGAAQSTTVRRPDHGGGGEIEFERSAPGAPPTAPSEGFDVAITQLPPRALRGGEQSALEVRISIHGNGVIAANDRLHVRGSTRPRVLEFGAAEASAPSLVHSAVGFAGQRVHEREIRVDLPFEVVDGVATDFADVVVSVEAEVSDGSSGVSQVRRRMAITARVALQRGDTLGAADELAEVAPHGASIDVAARSATITERSPPTPAPSPAIKPAELVRPLSVTTASELPVPDGAGDSTVLSPWLLAMAAGSMLALLVWLVVWRAPIEKPRS